MDYKKSMFILILGILVLLSVTCAWAGEANETTMAVTDADDFEISQDNQVIGQSNDFTDVDESANASTQNVAVSDEASQGGNADDVSLSSGEESAPKVGKMIPVVGSSFGKINAAIKSASDGDTVLLSEITYEGGKDDSITINKQIKIKGNGAVLNIYEKDNIFKITAKNVVLEDICFKGGSSLEGGAIYLTDDSFNCTISNCRFTDNHATRGSAIYDEGTNNKVLDCNIYSNCAEYGAVHFRGVNMTIADCTFTGNEATTGGGAVFLSGSGATVVNCEFSENFAKSYAGALQFNYRSVNCSVINSTFNDNYVRYSEAGAIADSGSGNVISRCDFKANYAKDFSEDVTGAAILSTGKNAEISYCTFSDHTAHYGAAIYFGDESSNCAVSNSHFTNNIANYGSAVYDNGSNNKVLNCDIYKNTVGGGSVCFSGVGGTVDGCVFTENGGRYGGAVYVNISSSNCTVSNSEFKSNTADEDGGAIYNKNALAIINSIFDSNSASLGGAIFNKDKMEIVNCGFNNNLANRGGDNVTAGTVLDVSSNCGGAILNVADLIVSGSTFENNNAIVAGGAISNIATLNLENSIFKKNGAYLGGAILNLFSMDVVGSNFTNNAAATQGGAILNQYLLTVSDSIFEINTAEKGGAVFNLDGTLTMFDSTFANNYAAGSGGAVYNLGKFDGENIKFKNNNATGHGGAIYSEKATLTMLDSTFTGNSAIDGGAIHNHDGTFAISNSRLTNNAAVVGGAIVNNGVGKMLNVTVGNNNAMHGAGICNYDGDLTITDSTLSNNAANYQGGAIYSNATLVLKNSILESNSANNGGALYLAQGDASLTNDVFEKNTATGGGAILNFNSALEIAQSRFTENAASAGSAIWTAKAVSLRITSRSIFVDNTDNMKSVRADEGSVDTSNCEFLYSISFEIGHIDDIVIDSPITINVAAKMKNAHLFNGNVVVNIGTESCIVKIINGSGKLTVTPNLASGKYKATLNFNVSNFIPTSAESNEFEVVKKQANIKISDIASFTVGSSVAIAVSADKSFNGKLVVSIGGADYDVNVVNGSGSRKISPNLAEGTYAASIKFQGNDKFAAQNVESNNFKVSKVRTSIKSSDVSVDYGVEKNLVAVLRDSSNKPIAGVKVMVTLSDGKSFARTTDKEGRVYVSTKGLAAKTYTAVIKFDGNKKYASSSKSVKVTVKKLTTVLSASKTTFKVKSTKKLSVTLRVSKGKCLKDKSVTFTYKGKTYKLKTNSNGIASLKLSITKVGKTNVVVKFAGDDCHKGVSKTITVKTVK